MNRPPGARARAVARASPSKTPALKRKDGQQRFEPLGSPAHVSMAALTRPSAGAQAGEREDSGVKLPQSGTGKGRRKDRVPNWGKAPGPRSLFVPSGPARQRWCVCRSPADAVRAAPCARPPRDRPSPRPVCRCRQ